MSTGFILLVLGTIIWIVLSWTTILPILSLPIARIKREYAIMLLVFGSVAFITEWVTRQSIHPVSAIALAAFLGISVGMAHLLKRLDYYVEELLQELFILSVTSAGISVVTSLWYWGIAGFQNLLGLRIVVAAIPVVVFMISWFIAKQKYSVWAIALYIAMFALKWVTFPLWGIWTVVLILLYATLTGYVAQWMVSTTYAEKVFAWNIAPSKVWGVLVITAGVLVVFF